jgi:hypothetical protein
MFDLSGRSQRGDDAHLLKRVQIVGPEPFLGNLAVDQAVEIDPGIGDLLAGGGIPISSPL